MRIIAGSARGRKLATPEGWDIRPTPDRVREALFSLVAAHLPGARTLDLFSGTGALGIEALSRGADHVTFVDSSDRAIELCRKNLTVLNGAGSARFIQQPVEAALASLAGSTAFDLIFVDPPYDSGLLDSTLAAIIKDKDELGLLAKDGVILCEHRRQADAPSCPAGLALVQTRHWGDVAVSIYSRCTEGAADCRVTGGPP